jgi:deoxyribose-phosphate aldolase
MPEINILNHIEYTLLRPDATQAEFEKLLETAKTYKIYGICVPPYWVRKMRRDIGSDPVKLVTVAAFPFGYEKAEVKLAEIKQAIEDGADEIDTVLNITAFKTGMPAWAKAEIAQASKACHEAEKVLKVIIETAYLSDKEIAEACKLCSDAGADFVKTSTGYASSGATIRAVEIMKRNIGSHVGIKASGGIKTKEFAWSLIAAGAERIGTSAPPDTFI